MANVTANHRKEDRKKLGWDLDAPIGLTSTIDHRDMRFRSQVLLTAIMCLGIQHYQHPCAILVKKSSILVTGPFAPCSACCNVLRTKCNGSRLKRSGQILLASYGTSQQPVLVACMNSLQNIFNSAVYTWMMFDEKKNLSSTQIRPELHTMSDV